MRIDTLPFLHYMVRINGGNETRLLSPIEADENSASGGSFVAPVQRDGELLPAYRFHFSIYLGHGEFVKDRDRKRLFSGIALTLQMGRTDHLLLTFGLPWPEPFWPPHFWHHLPDVLRAEKEFVVPLLRRAPRRSLLRYGGSMTHPDFEHSFAELEPSERGILDVILERFRISIIGCDPHTKYQKK
jgi:hypothetical protein